MPVVDMQFVKWTQPLVDHVLDNPTGIVSVSYTRPDGTDVNGYRFACKDFVYAFLMSMYDKQTLAEKEVSGANEHDGKGFNRYDATLLMDVARNSRDFYGLTDRQAEMVARKLKKYRKQFVQVVENKTAQMSYNKTRPIQTSMFAKGYER